MRNRLKTVERTKNQYDVYIQDELNYMYELAGKIDMMQATMLDGDVEKLGQIQNYRTEFCRIHNEIMTKFRDEEELSMEFTKGSEVIA